MSTKVSIRLKKTPSENHEILIKALSDRYSSGSIKETTHLVYLNQLRMIERLTGSEGEFDLDLIEKFDWKTVPSSIQRSTFDNLLVTIYMFYKILGHPLNDQFKDIILSKKDQVYDAEIHAPKKSLPFKSYEEFQALFPKTSEDLSKFFSLCPSIYQRGKNMMYLAFAFMTQMPPMRPSEIINLAITTKDIDGNYLNINTGKMMFTDYKTQRTYGDLQLDVPPSLLAILKHFFITLYGYHGDIGVRYIFTKDDGELMLPNNFTKMFCKIPYLQGITPTDLRNLCVSSLDGEDAVSKAVIAKYMKHSSSTQNRTYTKYNATLYPELQ